MCILRSFLKANVQNGIFGGGGGVAKISNIFGALDIPDIIFFGEGGAVDPRSKPMYEENMRVPPWGFECVAIVRPASMPVRVM